MSSNAPYNINVSADYGIITAYQGWLGGGYNYTGTWNSSGWNYFSIQTENTGIYLATISVLFQNSPNAFVYITNNYYYTTNYIPDYNQGICTVANLGNYVSTGSWTGGNPPSQFNSDNVLAGSQSSTTTAGQSSALTVTAMVYAIGNATTITFLVNKQNNNNVGYNISLVRIG